jgi:predicted ATPase
MFDSIGFNNFKCFASKGKVLPAVVEIRRLTLFYGYNNSGKSALLRGCCMVNRSLATCEEPLDRTLPVFSKLMSLEEVITQGSRNKLSISASKDHARLFWELRAIPETASYKVERFELCMQEVRLSATWQPESDLEDGGDVYDVRLADGPDERRELSFRGLIPSGLDEIATTVEAFRSEDSKHLWLHSNRKIGARYVDKLEIDAVDLDPDGSGCAELLYRAKYRLKGGAVFLSQVSKFFEDTFNQRIVIEPIGRQFEIKFENVNSLERVNVCDAGQGLQELLPIIAYLNTEYLHGINVKSISIEEPESHLHPKFHSALGTEFCRIASHGAGPNLLIETHSQNLMLSIQVEIASGRMDPNDTIVYWVRSDQMGRSIAEKVTFDEKGRPSGNWPPDVFSADAAQSRELFALRQNQK